MLISLDRFMRNPNGPSATRPKRKNFGFKPLEMGMWKLSVNLAFHKPLVLVHFSLVAAMSRCFCHFIFFLTTKKPWKTVQSFLYTVLGYDRVSEDAAFCFLEIAEKNEKNNRHYVPSSLEKRPSWKKTVQLHIYHNILSHRHCLDFILLNFIEKGNYFGTKSHTVTLLQDHTSQKCVKIFSNH